MTRLRHQNLLLAHTLAPGNKFVLVSASRGQLAGIQVRDKGPYAASSNGASMAENLKNHRVLVVKPEKMSTFPAFHFFSLRSA
jgi:hypothetical protein